MTRQAAVLGRSNGRIAYGFHARDVHLVMGPARPGTTIRFACGLTAVRREPRTAPTLTIGATARSSNTACINRFAKSPIVDRHFDIEFLDAGAGAYAFTFG